MDDSTLDWQSVLSCRGLIYQAHLIYIIKIINLISQTPVFICTIKNVGLINQAPTELTIFYVILYSFTATMQLGLQNLYFYVG